MFIHSPPSWNVLSKKCNNEARKLCSIYSGVSVELMEQKRKHGFIRCLDNNFEAVGVLPLLDSEYLALIVETSHMLSDPSTKARTSLFNIEGIIEDYLIGLATEEVTDDLVINLPDVDVFDPNKSRLSPKKQTWLRKNSFHAATRIVEAVE